jgi:hypothetical protein
VCGSVTVVLISLWKLKFFAYLLNGTTAASARQPFTDRHRCRCGAYFSFAVHTSAFFPQCNSGFPTMQLQHPQCILLFTCSSLSGQVGVRLSSLFDSSRSAFSLCSLCHSSRSVCVPLFICSSSSCQVCVLLRSLCDSSHSVHSYSNGG